MVYLIDGVEGAWCLATKAGQQVHLGLELWPDGTMQFWCATACQAVNEAASSMRRRGVEKNAVRRRAGV